MYGCAEVGRQCCLRVNQKTHETTFRESRHGLSTRVRQGRGIGLSLVKKLVTLHEGSIEATSQGLGEGSEFVVRLPLLPVDLMSATTHSPIPRKTNDGTDLSAHTKRILVVDDNVDAAESLQMLLSVYGHTVEIAHEGVTALQVAWAFKPDLVFLDIGLPGMDGHEVARRLRGIAVGVGNELHQ